MVSSEGSCAAYHNHEFLKSQMVPRIPCSSLTGRENSFPRPQIEMARHSAGGKAGRRLVEGLFAPLLFHGPREPLGDAAMVAVEGTHVAFTTDSFVVKPLRFPGGSIGELAVNGTVNDLAVSGARAAALAVSFILEAGLPGDVLEAEVRAMGKAACAAGVRIASGDTKVVEHGQADHMYITTTGIGIPIPGVSISPRSVVPGDKILLSGPIGDHGVTILLARGELDFEADICSDTRPVLPLIRSHGGGRRRRRFGGCAILRAAAASPPSPQRTGARLRLGVRLLGKRKFRSATWCGRRVSCWGSIRFTLPTKVSFWPWSSRDAAEAALEAATRILPAVRVRDNHRRSVRAAIQRRSRHHALWRQPDRGHAGRGSAPANLLRTPMDRRPVLTNLVERRLMERNEVFRQFFAREARRLALASREMSERFLKGGRLLAFRTGTGVRHRRAACLGGVRTSRDHVGKQRAARSRPFHRVQPWLEAIAFPEDIVMGFGPPEGDPEVWEALQTVGRGGAMTFALPGLEGSYFFEAATPDPFMHQEMVEILYHTLWETVHVFFEHRELGHDVGDAGFLYPFLGQEKQDTDGIVEQVAASIQMKVEDDAS